MEERTDASSTNHLTLVWLFMVCQNILYYTALADLGWLHFTSRSDIVYGLSYYHWIGWILEQLNFKTSK